MIKINFKQHFSLLVVALILSLGAFAQEKVQNSIDPPIWI